METGLSGGQSYRYATIKSKMEYHATVGPEEVTRSEAVRWWLHATLRPNGVVMVPRIAAHTSELMRLDVLPENVIRGWNMFDPHQLMRQLWQSMTNIIAELSPDEGPFLVKHGGGEKHLSILAPLGEMDDQPGTVSFDLRTDQQKVAVSQDVENVGYIPVKWVKVPDQIDYTFPPLGTAVKTAAGVGSTSNIQEPVHYPRGKPLFSKKVAFCHRFALKGSCKTKDCKYGFHYTMKQLEDLSLVRFPGGDKKQRGGSQTRSRGANGDNMLAKNASTG